MTLSSEGKDIVVKGVSDSRLTYTTSLISNIRRIKISTNATITSDFNFDINIAYINKLNNQEVLKSIPCVFKASTPGSLAIVSGNNQTGGPIHFLTNPFVVSVKDQFGAPLKGTTVTWQVITGGGSLTTSTSVTDINGQAANTWKMGSTGSQQATATVTKGDGTTLVASFSATVPAVTITGYSSATECYDCVQGCGGAYKTARKTLIVTFNVPPDPSAHVTFTTIWDPVNGGQGSVIYQVQNMTKISDHTYSIAAGFCWGAPNTNLYSQAQYKSGTYESNKPQITLPCP